MLDNKEIFLLSHSPRRRELLERLGIKFKITTSNVKEVYPHNLSPIEIAKYLSSLKANNTDIELHANTICISADTVVCLDNKILGKPEDEKESYDMLCSLSGRSHQVITGVTIKGLDKQITFAQKTDVTFNHLSREDILYYIRKYSPFDKAGSYGIQEWIGMIGVKSINGCFYNVMGLPIAALYEELKKF